jgi:short-subunit dehydrogenase
MSQINALLLFIILVFVIGPYIPWGADLSYTPMLLRESITRTPLGGTSNWDSAVYYLSQIIYKYSLTEKNLIQRYGTGSWTIITGASSGQGRCMALKLAARGFNLILIGSVRTKQVIREISDKWPSVQIKFIEKNFSESYDDSWWQNDIIPLFDGTYDISILFNNVGQRSANNPSHKQSIESITGTIITGTLPQVRLTNLAIEYMITRPENLHSAIIFNTAQCIHPVIGLSQYYGAEITVPYLSVYEATNAFGYYHASSTAESQLLVHPEGVRLMDSRSSVGVYDKSAPHGIITEYGSNPKYNHIDMLNITPGAVLTEKTEPMLHNTMFAVKADKFIDNIPWGADLSYTPTLLRESINRTPSGCTSNWDSAVLRLMGNWQGTTCAYWGHELAPILISFAPWLKRRILSDVPWGADLSYTPTLLRESINRTPSGCTINWDSAVGQSFVGA